MDQRHVAATEVQALHTRVVELEVEVVALRERYEVLEGFVDRLVVFLRRSHGDDGAALRPVEEAAAQVIRAR